MPTRPTRRERRRADRRNASNVSKTAPQTKPTPCSITETGPLSPTVFLDAAPIVRTVMRVVLIQTSYTISQVFGFEVWKEVLELSQPRPSAPNNDHLEHQILCFDAIIALHDTHILKLKKLQLDYAQQVIMWALECSKAREVWSLAFIARRELELAQLNRMTKRMAIAFEEKLQQLLGNSHAFSSQQERAYLLQTLERFRVNFAEGVRLADKETALALKEAEF